MPTDPIHPVTAEVATACDALDGAISTFLKARGSIAGYGQYESTSEALNLFNLVIRDIEGVIALAREDLTLLPPAFACARAALETAAKAAWMVDANDAYVREVRWLAHLQEEERVYERAAKRTIEGGRDGQGFTDHAAALKNFRLAVTLKLPQGANLTFSSTIQRWMKFSHR